jgi:hypothetical protein
MATGVFHEIHARRSSGLQPLAFARECCARRLRTSKAWAHTPACEWLNSRSTMSSKNRDGPPLSSQWPTSCAPAFHQMKRTWPSFNEPAWLQANSASSVAAFEFEQSNHSASKGCTERPAKPTLSRISRSWWGRCTKAARNQAWAKTSMAFRSASGQRCHCVYGNFPKTIWASVQKMFQVYFGAPSRQRTEGK